MDNSSKVVINFTEALKSEYGIDSGKLVFKHVTKDSIHVYYDNELILSFQFDYIIGHGNTADIVSLFIADQKSPKTETNMNEISKFTQHDKVFEDGIRHMLRRLDLDISKKSVINNAQDIIEITKKAKEDNIKKDIENIESEILERAKDGEDSVIYYLSELKTNISREESDNEIIKHFRNKGFSCSVKEGSLGKSLLRISWED